MLNVALIGSHAHRTPFAYPAYRKIAESHFNFQANAECADLLIFGFQKDIVDEFESVRALADSGKKRLIVLSEEPLWDSLWSGDYSLISGSVNGSSGSLKYDFFSHFNTDIYNFERFPYFLTTNDHFFIRYANLFQRNSRMSTGTILANWRRAPIRQAYFAERRAGSGFAKMTSDGEILGLCEFRTCMAVEAKGAGVMRVGMGWDNTVRRQALPDWHLDKLATLDRRSFIVSGIENTHQHDYVTEKIFDAFAVLSIPLYVASPYHSVHRLVPENSYINLYGLSAAEAINKVADFDPGTEFVDAYREAQHLLAERFSDAAGYVEERRRIFRKIYTLLHSG